MPCECDDCQGYDIVRAENDDNLRDFRELAAIYEPFIQKLESIGFHYLSNGGFRNVYIRKNVVIKIPRYQDGMNDNRVEARAWHKYRNNATNLGFYLAPCRLLSNGCLMMVATQTIDTNITPYPDWTKELNDGRQVGLYKDRIVSYDFALEINERDQWEKEWGTYSKFFQILPKRMGS